MHGPAGGRGDADPVDNLARHDASAHCDSICRYVLEDPFPLNRGELFAVADRFVKFERRFQL